MNNPFLNDFIKMRQNLHAQNIIKDATNMTKSEPVKKSGMTDISIATIIDKKPSSKKVLDYFKNKYDCSV
jgi:hypothetical protein